MANTFYDYLNVIFMGKTLSVIFHIIDSILDLQAGYTISLILFKAYPFIHSSNIYWVQL